MILDIIAECSDNAPLRPSCSGRMWLDNAGTMGPGTQQQLEL